MTQWRHKQKWNGSFFQNLTRKPMQFCVNGNKNGKKKNHIEYWGWICGIWDYLLSFIESTVRHSLLYVCPFVHWTDCLFSYPVNFVRIMEIQIAKKKKLMPIRHCCHCRCHHRRRPTHIQTYSFFTFVCTSNTNILMLSVKFRFLLLFLF